MPKHMSYEDRFLQKVFKTESCWLWVGAVNSKGYGSFTFNGKRILAHRYSYILNKGEIPEGMFICHTCDNPACVNPEHLWIGSPLENMVDMFSKGRQGYQNKKQTHCRKGHSFDEFGFIVYIKKTGRQSGQEWRTCKECKRLSNEARNIKRRKNKSGVGGQMDKATDF